MPAALPDFMDLMAMVVSTYDGGFVLISSSSCCSIPSKAKSGSGLFRTYLKCSSHIADCSFSVVMILPELLFTGDTWLAFPHTCSSFVILYTLFRSPL